MVGDWESLPGVGGDLEDNDQLWNSKTFENIREHWRNTREPWEQTSFVQSIEGDAEVDVVHTASSIHNENHRG